MNTSVGKRLLLKVCFSCHSVTCCTWTFYVVEWALSLCHQQWQPPNMVPAESCVKVGNTTFLLNMKITIACN